MRLILPLISLISSSSFAQNISGKITDHKRRPLKSATVLLLKQKDSSLLRSAMSDSAGRFRFLQVQQDSFLVSVSMIGYKTSITKAAVTGNNAEMEPIRLEPGAEELEDVTVTAVKPFLEQKADKLVVNIEGSATAAGATAFEVLKKVPGVLVINDKISIVGKGSPSIMIDGRLSQYTDMQQVLKSMSSANIEKIELIMNPGARYDAAGGAIINIVLRRNAGLGTNGTINMEGSRTIYNSMKAHTDRDFYSHSEGFAINHRKNKWNLFGEYGFLHNNDFDYAEFNRLIAASRFLQTNYSPENETTHTYRAGIDFFADARNTFGVMVSGFAKHGLTEAQNLTRQLDAASGHGLDSFTTFNKTRSNNTNTSANLNWKHNLDTAGRMLNMDIDYSTFMLSDNSDISTRLSNGMAYPNLQSVHNPVHFLVFKADYEHPFGKKAKLEAGVKSGLSAINNYLQFIRNGVYDSSRSTDFVYKEHINAVYSSLRYNLDKWQLQGGLRAEQTIATGRTRSQLVLDRKYWQLFPSASVTRKINADLSTTLAYSRRVNRPGYEQQNPFIEYVDSLLYSKGNPQLKPETLDEYKLSLAYKSEPFLSISYNKKHDVIVDDAPKQEGNLTYTTPENLASYENIAVELNFPIELGNKITGYGGSQAIYNHYKAMYLGGLYDRSKWNWLAYWQVNYKPTSTWSFEVSGYYQTPLLNEFLLIRELSNLDIGVRKYVWDKRGRLNLNFSDVLFSQKTRGSLVYQDINVGFRGWSTNRNLRLTFTWSFGNQKLKAARERQTASEDEKGRVKTDKSKD